MKAADCLSFSFLGTVKVSDSHRHKSANGGAYQKIQAPIASDLSLLQAALFLCLPDFFLCQVSA